MNAILICFNGCSSEVEFPLKKDYLVLETLPYEALDKRGVTLNAKLVGEHTGNISEVGFIWGDVETSFKYPTILEKNAFSLRLESDLSNGKDYGYQAYVKIDSLLLLGNRLIFSSLGTIDPTIGDFYPKSGFVGDTVTIHGNYFSLNRERIEVTLNDYVCQIVSADVKHISVIVPYNIVYHSGQLPLKVQSGNTQIMAKESFLIEGFQITEVNPDHGIVGETLIDISGITIETMPNSIEVYFGNHKAEEVTRIGNTIRARLPYQMSSGSYQVSVKLDSTQVISNSTIEVLSRWQKINDFPSDGRVLGNLIPVGNVAYYLFGSTSLNSDIYFNEIWRYSFDSDEWALQGNFPGQARGGAITFNINGIIYYGLGVTGANGFFNDFWKYNPAVNQWTRLKNFTGPPKVKSQFLSMSGNGYVIGSSYYDGGIKEIWRYDPALDQWDMLGEIGIANGINNQDATFTYKGEIYVVDISNPKSRPVKVFKFSPGTPSIFEEIATLPFGPPAIQTMPIVFVLNNKLYLENTSRFQTKTGWQTETQMFTLNLESIEWARIENFPEALSAYQNSFSYNNYGYVGFISPTGADVTKKIWRYDATIQ
ncbi:IPT/TIG domain-containing protein [uncultured Imperialibacter sp.]|uniref:IPT/TIG domain-containing protein n=1 Tax=uncultured Imperialibacter sp. TaxID=1672639 RepID=UPI0030D7CBD0